MVLFAQLIRALVVAVVIWLASVGQSVADPRCAAIAIGGTASIVNVGGQDYCVLRFDSPGTSIFDLRAPRDVEYLLIGGGGGGGAYAGGGGGGGGFRTGFVSLTAGARTISVGAGGLGDNRTVWPNAPVDGGENGQSSSAFGIVALGGGGGGTYNSGTVFWRGRDGASGGGGSHTAVGGQGTSDQGFAGGRGTSGCGNSSGGGGGGAAQQGGNGTVDVAGRGGDGRTSSITGTLTSYGGGGAGAGDRRNTSCGDNGVPGVLPNVGGFGGGGASRNDMAAGNNGVNGLGGGGAGGNVRFSNDPSRGGDGGSGVVILRFLLNYPPLANAGADQSVTAFAEVTLDAILSNDPDGDPLDYSWTQISGTTIVLTGTTTITPTFTAPQPADGLEETLIFQLTVTDPYGLTATDTVSITVRGVADLIVTKLVSVIYEDGHACHDLTAQHTNVPEFPAAIPGACIEFIINVLNGSVITATNVNLRDEIPVNLTLRNAGLAMGWGSESSIAFTHNCSGAGCFVELSNGTIAGQTTASITIRATVN
jgi:uncharacterized repeat protein (TIGR01451 family)